jgi:hypothetical protein
MSRTINRGNAAQENDMTKQKTQNEVDRPIAKPKQVHEWEHMAWTTVWLRSRNLKPLADELEIDLRRELRAYDVPTAFLDPDGHLVDIYDDEMECEEIRQFDQRIARRLGLVS